MEAKLMKRNEIIMLTAAILLTRQDAIDAANDGIEVEVLHRRAVQRSRALYNETMRQSQRNGDSDNAEAFS
jgi:hypothetical protein